MVDEDKLRRYLRKVTTELQQSRRRLEELTADGRELVAVVGLSCRLPGGVTCPDELWELLDAGRDAVSAPPEDRGWDAAGDPRARAGGFVHDAAAFDAEFFGVEPQEALAMDPQHRLLLEASWEALERGGVDPRRVRGTRVGVYAGLAYGKYSELVATAVGDGVADHLTTGGATSTASGRVAYALGLEGPAITIDTACSSSLVALHLACQGLRDGDCTLALAGGVTVMSSPDVFDEYARRQSLASGGRSRPFAAAADGIGFGEGVGMVLLERLSDARRNGHPVLAVIRGSAVNQDGATNGLTAPSGPAQQRVILQALADAGLTPDQVDAVEAHGAGSSLGDPLEAQALIATYGRGRREGRPLRLGSVKSNIGHTQIAAGAAGVIKMVLALRHERLPRTLHVDAPTPHVNWSGGSVELLTEPVAWPRGDRPRRAGVSAFGVSGTNAHVILEEPPEDAGEEPGVPPSVLPWVLSGTTAEALRAQAGRLRAFLLGRPGADAVDVGYALATTRSAFRHRAVLFGTARDTLLEDLRALEDGETPESAVVGTGGTRGESAVLFGGEESWTPGMGRELSATFPVFAGALEAVCAPLDAALGDAVRPVRALLLGDRDELSPAEAAAARFAFQLALYRLVESFGVTPDHIVADPAGEIAAAQAAGMLSLPDACALLASRIRPGGAAPDAGPPEISALSTATGGPLTAERLRGTAEPGGDGDGHGDDPAGELMRRLADDGVTVVLGLGATGELPLLGADRSEPLAFLRGLADAYARGAVVDWGPAFGGRRRAVELPTYPFQRRRFWAGGGAAAPLALSGPVIHPLLGARIDLATAPGRWYAHTPAAARLRGRQRLYGTPVLPAAALVEWALAAARQGDGTSTELRDVTFDEVLPLPGEGAIALQAVADNAGVRCFARRTGDDAGEWTRHLTVASCGTGETAPGERTGPAGLSAGMEERDTSALRARLERLGLEDSSPCLMQLWRRGDEAVGRIACEADPAYLLDPLVLDACLQAAAAVVDGGEAGGGEALPLPASAGRIAVRVPLPSRVWCHVRRRDDGALDVRLLNDSGERLAAVERLRFRTVTPGAMPALAGTWLRQRELSGLVTEDPAAARAAVLGDLFDRVTALLGLPAARTHELAANFGSARLNELGMDSLRAVRLRDGLLAGLAVDVPLETILRGGTAEALAGLICEQLTVRSLLAVGEAAEDEMEVLTL